MKVLYGVKFHKHLQNFPQADQLKILAFVRHVQAYGLMDLVGRNKSSDDVPRSNPNWLERVKYAQEHQLWHYHIGIPEYYGEDGIRPASMCCIISDGMMRLFWLIYHPIRHYNCLSWII